MKIKSTKILAAILILILAVQAPLSAFAFTGKSMFTSSTYTHQDRFKDETIYQGIDVSKHNGDIDWKKLKKEGVDFVIIRVGYRGYGQLRRTYNKLSVPIYFRSFVYICGVSVDKR